MAKEKTLAVRFRNPHTDGAGKDYESGLETALPEEQALGLASYGIVLLVDDAARAEPAVDDAARAEPAVDDDAAAEPAADDGADGAEGTERATTTKKKGGR